NTNTEDTKIMHVFESNLTEKLINKPTNLLEWKQRHCLIYYLNKNQKVKIYLISGISGQWYGRIDILRLKYNHDGTLMNCDIPCIWNVTDLGDLTLEELKTADALLCVDYHILPEKKSWEGQNSKVPTSYIQSDPNILRTKLPFNVENLDKNSTIVSFIASHWTDFRNDWVPKLQAHISVASFGVDLFKLGVVPIVWGAPNTRSYLPHPKSAIFIEDYPNRTMTNWPDGFEKKAYMGMYNMECNICKEVARLRVIEERLGVKNGDLAKVSPYECGFAPVGTSRQKFSIVLNVSLNSRSNGIQ
ncbi:13477_t:CDS:2, partial [Gigaspora rosea]